MRQKELPNMARKQNTIDNPLWNRLRALDKIAARKFPANFDQGFGTLGLILDSRPRASAYSCTPKNCLSFAYTGGEGVHFSFVAQDGKATERSPIVITIPEAFDHPNFIGGESLFDFLCLGYHRGYFALENLDSDKCFEAYASEDWQPTTESDYHVGYVLDNHQRDVLQFLIEELGLSPWKDLKRKFKHLQKLYMPLLQIPDNTEHFG
jgi:hypothetical protein